MEKSDQYNKSEEKKKKRHSIRIKVPNIKIGKIGRRSRDFSDEQNPLQKKSAKTPDITKISQITIKPEKKELPE